MKYLLFLFFGFITVTISAHNTNEITYEFDLNKNSNTLTIHFTPKSAIDLIRTIKPELQQEAIIKLDEFYFDFTNYFNNTINLKMGENPIRFSFKYADLQSHDAIFALNIIGTPKEYGQLELDLNSFLEVYDHTNNFVMFKTENEFLEGNLDKDNHFYKSTINGKVLIEEFDSKLAVFLLLISISLILFLLRKEIFLVIRR